MNLSKNTNILITGASGFVGSHLAQYFCENGFKIACIVRNSSSLQRLSHCNFQLYYYDGTFESLDSIFKSFQPTIVLHLATLYLPSHKAQDIQALIESNILLGSYLLEAMVNNNVEFVINTGTFSQTFNNISGCSQNFYAATKQAFEVLVDYYVRDFNLKALTLRLPTPYGANNHENRIIELLLSAHKTKTVLKLSPGEQWLDLLSVEDVKNAYLIAIEELYGFTQPAHKQYRLSSNSPIRLKDLIVTLEKLLGEKLPVEFGVLPYRKNEFLEPWTHGNLLPNWNPKISLEEGLNEILSIDKEAL